jgi:GNAT superfamily N-acetyltransferase
MPTTYDARTRRSYDRLVTPPRRATVDERLGVVDLHHACWLEAYVDLIGLATVERVFADRAAAVEVRRQRVADPTAPTYVVEQDGELVGFATAGPARRVDPPAQLELRAIYARAATWGTGVGDALLAASVGRRAAYLWVLDGNDRAIGFYRRHGFALDGTSEEHEEGRHLRMVRGGPRP